MKKLLFILFFIMPSVCFGGVDLAGVQVENITVGYKPFILCVGDSITQGTGNSFSYNSTDYSNVGGYRTELQKLIVIRSRNFVGQWGVIDGTNATLTPEYETHVGDNNYLLKYNFQPRHFGFGGGDTETMVDAFNDLNQETWFGVLDTKNTVIIFLGTNDTQSSGDPDYNVDTSNIPTVVNKLISLVDTVDSIDSNVAIIVCLIVPAFFDYPNPRYAFLNEWVQAYNPQLETAIITKQITKTNLYYVDLYSPLIDNWITTFTSDGVHPNNVGYKKIAEILYNKMIEEGLL
jgi:lysophospholipase L1-like esterase